MRQQVYIQQHFRRGNARRRTGSTRQSPTGSKRIPGFLAKERSDEQFIQPVRTR
jgi:hypothetical protein